MPFSRVIASDVPRTVETALAMGFAVDEILGFPPDCDWDAVIGEMVFEAGKFASAELLRLPRSGSV